MALVVVIEAQIARHLTVDGLQTVLFDKSQSLILVVVLSAFDREDLVANEAVLCFIHTRIGSTTDFFAKYVILIQLVQAIKQILAPSRKRSGFRVFCTLCRFLLQQRRQRGGRQRTTSMRCAWRMHVWLMWCMLWEMTIWRVVCLWRLLRILIIGIVVILLMRDLLRLLVCVVVIIVISTLMIDVIVELVTMATQIRVSHLCFVLSGCVGVGVGLRRLSHWRGRRTLRQELFSFVIDTLRIGVVADARH